MRKYHFLTQIQEKSFLCTDSEIHCLSEANNKDGVAKFLVLRYISFTKYICTLSAEKKVLLRAKAERKWIISYSGWHFWVTLLTSLALGELGIAGEHPEPHPATCQHGWMGTPLQRVFHPCFMRCSYWQNLVCVFASSERGKWLRQETWSLQKVPEELLRVLSQGFSSACKPSSLQCPSRSGHLL